MTDEQKMFKELYHSDLWHDMEDKAIKACLYTLKDSVEPYNRIMPVAISGETLIAAISPTLIYNIVTLAVLCTDDLSDDTLKKIKATFDNAVEAGIKTGVSDEAKEAAQSPNRG